MTIKAQILIFRIYTSENCRKLEKRIHSSDFAYQMTNNLYLARDDSKKKK